MQHKSFKEFARKQLIRVCLLALWLAPLAAHSQTNQQIKRGAAVRQRENKDLYAGSFALVIGVSDYTGGWDKLPGVAQDVTAVEAALKSQGFVVRTILNPKKNDLTNAVQQFIDDYGFDFQNRLLIYYAGHGHTDSLADGRSFGYIVPADAPLPAADKIAFERKAVDMRSIENFAEQIRAKHALFVFDSCFSGKLLSRSEIRVPPYIADELMRPVRQFITAGAANQEVPDESIFRKLFVRALAGDADEDRDGFILGSELAKFLKREVTTHSNRTQTPQYGKILNLDLNQGDFVFVSPNNAQTAAVVNAQTKITPAANPTNSVASSAPQPAFDVEAQFWARIEKSGDAEDFDDYLREYPKGRFAPLARQRLREIKRKESNSSASSQPNPVVNPATNQTSNNANSAINSSGNALKPVFDLRSGKTSYQGKFEYNNGLTLPFDAASEIKEIDGAWTIIETIAFKPNNLKSLPAAEQANLLAQMIVVNAVSLDKNTLLPIEQYYKDGQMSFNVRFLNDNAIGTATTNGKTQNVNIALPAPIFGGGAYDALATLPLAAGYTTVWHSVEPQTSKIKTYALRVANVERVRVAAGEFDAYKVALTADDNLSVQTVWIDRASRKIVKLNMVTKESGGATVSYELHNNRE